jgi:hypothetical protein
MIGKGTHRSIELQERIVLRHRSGEGCQNISAALKLPKNTVASILKWEKGVGLEGVEKLDRVLVFLCGDGRTFQKDNHLCSTPTIKPLW